MTRSVLLRSKQRRETGNLTIRGRKSNWVSERAAGRAPFILLRLLIVYFVNAFETRVS